MSATVSERIVAPHPETAAGAAPSAARGPHRDPSLLFGLLGEHLDGSLTPLMHESEAARHGITLAYRRLDSHAMGLATPDWAELVGQAARLTFDGLNVTHPAKQAVIPALTELDADAELLGAVNTILFRGDRRIGMNTDHLGFSEALSALRAAGADPGLERVVQLGAGGAGAATAYALLRAGAQRLDIVDVDADRARALVERLSRGFDRARMAVCAPEDAPGRVAAADGLVNSTPIGMTGVSDESPIDVAALHPGLWVGDAVYRPLRTTLVRAAERIGCPAFGGAQMVVGQAAAAFEFFTGRSADRAAMHRDFAAASGQTRRDFGETR